jgi:RNA polymerase sigma factor (sigma-70 family)
MTPEQERQAAVWMRLAQAGDQEAYASLLAMLTSVTRKFARNRLGDVPWIDDVVQETLMTVHRARATYDGHRPFAPWFYAIASSRLVDVLRRERRTSGRELPVDPAFDPPAPAPAADHVDVGAIQAALKSLPARQREVIERLKFRDESVKDIAAGMQMTTSTVKVTAHRGYQRLRTLLGGAREKRQD